jgi:hypothetical protein
MVVASGEAASREGAREGQSVLLGDLDAIKREVTEIYSIHNPQKLGGLGALWRKYQGQPAQPAQRAALPPFLPPSFPLSTPLSVLRGTQVLHASPCLSPCLPLSIPLCL